MVIFFPTPGLDSLKPNTSHSLERETSRIAQMPETLDRPIPEAEDWGAVRFLTRELERTEQVVASIAQWDLAVRLFRAVERQRFFENEPTDFDRANHKALLHVLIGLGQQHELRIKQFSDEELARFGINRANLAAYIRDLEDTFFLWHVPDFEPARTAKLEQAIFGADT
jgi:hypothetical protein